MHTVYLHEDPAHLFREYEVSPTNALLRAECNYLMRTNILKLTVCIAAGAVETTTGGTSQTFNNISHSSPVAKFSEEGCETFLFPPQVVIGHILLL